MEIILPETNEPPESLGLEDVCSFLLAGAMLVLGRVDKVAVFTSDQLLLVSKRLHPTQAVYVQGYASIRKCLQFHDPRGRGQIFTEVILDVVIL